MKNTQFALFMVLNGRATEALTFYQEAFAGDILFKITNQEFKERLNPSLTIPAGEEHWLSHSILQMDTFQLQLADNPLFAGMNTTPTEQLTVTLPKQFLKNSRAIPNPVLSKNQLKMNLQHFMRL